MNSDKVSSLSSRLVEPNRHLDHFDGDEDDDAIFAELEAELEDHDNALMREKGLDVIKREMERIKSLQASQHGTYSEITDEKEVIRTTVREPRCIIHFYHSNFKRCETMDKHLAKLAGKYFHTRFIRVFVENIPWLVEKLSVKVLPCVICFIDGVAKDRLIGFEDLGQTDNFDTAVLELRLLKIGVIQKPSNQNVYDPVYEVSSSLKDNDCEVFDLDD